MRTSILTLFFFAALFAAILVVAGSAWSARTCTGAIRHPVDARVVALDPIRRGAVVRFEVTASSRVDLKSTWVRVLPTPGLVTVGPAHAELVPGGRDPHERKAIIRIVVPGSGPRQLVQFRIEGEGPSGLLTRGVAFNLMPDGPVESLRRGLSGSGEGLLEATARRID